MGVAFIDKDVADLSRRFAGRRGGNAPPIGAPSGVSAKSALVLGTDGKYHWQEICATATGKPVKFNGHATMADDVGNGNGKKKKTKRRSKLL